jgi:hypothetical protein
LPARRDDLYEGPQSRPKAPATPHTAATAAPRTDTTGAARPERPDRYRLTQRALALAAAEAAAGNLDDRIDATLAAHGYGDVFADRAALAAEAQTQWWQRLLGRLDATLNEDLAGISCDAVARMIQQAWQATVLELPGYLALAASASGAVTVRRGALRYARLLALFAGAASVDDEPLGAARTGMGWSSSCPRPPPPP